MPSIIIKQYWMTGWTGAAPPPPVAPTVYPSALPPRRHIKPKLHEISLEELAVAVLLIAKKRREKT